MINTVRDEGEFIFSLWNMLLLLLLLFSLMSALVN
jgi:hypothetical protein